MSEVGWVILYFVAGLAWLSILELSTKRISKRFKAAASDTQSALSGAGNPVGRRTAIIALVVVTILFWPATVIGVLASRRSKSGH